MITLTYDGSEYVGWTEADLLAAGVPQENIDAAISAASEASARAELRGRISQAAGDPLSLLGTTSDAAAISTLAVATLAVAVSNSSDYAAFKTAFLAALNSLSVNNDLVSISETFLGRIQSGDVVIPVMTKDMSTVVSEIETRSTAVSNAMTQN